MPIALATMLDLMNDVKVESKLVTLLKLDEVLGLGIQNMEEKALHAPNEVQKLLEERDEARKRKDWQTADIIRKK